MIAILNGILQSGIVPFVLFSVYWFTLITMITCALIYVFTGYSWKKQLNTIATYCLFINFSILIIIGVWSAFNL